MDAVEDKEKSPNEDSSAVEEVIIRVVGGPAAGREIPVESDKFTVGRAVSADISIPDTVISRTHVAIRFDDSVWRISDLGSTNGTWVRGCKIDGETELPLKTPVRIGNTLFELCKYEKKEDESVALDESLISYRVGPITAESIVFPGGKTEHDVQQSRQRLKAIYQVQSLLTSVSDESELYHKILDVVDAVIPSDTSYLLSYSSDQDLFEPVAGRNHERRLNLVTENFISRSIIDYVKKNNEAILSTDAPHDERFHSNSICGLNVQSVMCVPMVGQNHLCGVIYLSATMTAKEYRKDDLTLLTMVAHSAGMAIENSRLVKENLRSERMAAIGVTAAGLSHYVKNILNGLEGSVSLLRLGIDGSDTKLMNEAWEILSKNHVRLSALVLDMLNLSKDDSADLAMYNVADIVIETVELVGAKARDEKIEIVYDENIRGASMFAEIDSRGIHRVMLNLLNNAVDAVRERYGKDGGGVVEAGLHLDTKGQIMNIEVTDNGIGIPENLRGKVFEMFHTGKGDRGTGLGLAVSKRIIENHGGEIIVDSQPGNGATFVVKIPAHATSSGNDTTDVVNKK